MRWGALNSDVEIVLLHIRIKKLRKYITSSKLCYNDCGVMLSHSSPRDQRFTQVGYLPK